MARVTIEDCQKRGYNKFMLVHLAAKRVIQLRKGKEPLISTSNREIVTSLREIAAGMVRMRTVDEVSESDLKIESSPSPVAEIEAGSEKKIVMEFDASANDLLGNKDEIPENEADLQPVENEDTADTT